jgi:hypothetical protein
MHTRAVRGMADHLPPEAATVSWDPEQLLPVRGADGGLIERRMRERAAAAARREIEDPTPSEAPASTTLPSVLDPAALRVGGPLRPVPEEFREGGMAMADFR